MSLNAALERLAAIAGRPLDVRRCGRESGDVLHTGADITRAREALGYRPSTDLAAGLRGGVRVGAERACEQPRRLAVTSGR